MLTLDLVRLEKENGPVRLREEVPADSGLFEGVDLPLDSPLEVDLTIAPLQGEELLARGTLRGVLARECRRCLDPVKETFEDEVDFLFVPEVRDDGHRSGSGVGSTGEKPGRSGSGGAGEGSEKDDEGVYSYRPSSGLLDLTGPVREEVILAAPLYVECSTDCKGLCPVCGTNLNENECDCARDEPDPRWDALRALNTE